MTKQKAVGRSLTAFDHKAITNKKAVGRYAPTAFEALLGDFYGQ